MPKPLRAEVGLEAGGEVEVSVRDGRIEVEPATVSMRVVERGEHVVVEADGEMPVLTVEEVRATLERVRR